jgi:hypothetical protein
VAGVVQFVLKCLEGGNQVNVIEIYPANLILYNTLVFFFFFETEMNRWHWVYRYTSTPGAGDGIEIEILIRDCCCTRQRITGAHFVYGSMPNSSRLLLGAGTAWHHIYVLAMATSQHK